MSLLAGVHVFLSVINGSKTHAFRFPELCEPIEYGQLMDVDSPVIKPTPREIQAFAEKLGKQLLRRKNTLGEKYVYFPARFTQLRDLPDDIAQHLNTPDIEQRHEEIHDGVTSVLSRDTDVFWLDLSQVLINPYVDHLFTKDSRMKHRLGRWEITLRPSVTSKGLLLEQKSALDCLHGTIGTMLATYPPRTHHVKPLAFTLTTIVWNHSPATISY
jgi:hypothetical protein